MNKLIENNLFYPEKNILSYSPASFLFRKFNENLFILSDSNF